jgi:hypothetical protein
LVADLRLVAIAVVRSGQKRTADAIVAGRREVLAGARLSANSEEIGRGCKIGKESESRVCGSSPSFAVRSSLASASRCKRDVDLVAEATGNP